MSNNQELEERIDTLMRGILVESIGTPIAVDVFTGSEAKQALLRLIKDQQLALINKIEESIESASPELSDLVKDTPKIEDYETEEEWDTDCNIVNALRMGRNSAIQEFNSKLREGLRKIKEDI